MKKRTSNASFPIAAALVLTGAGAGCGLPDETGAGGSEVTTQQATTTGTVGFLAYSSLSTRQNMDIFMDTENTGNGDYLGRVGSNSNLTEVTGLARTTANHGGMLFKVNKVTLSSLPRLEFDYISLLFSDSCPTNGIRFGEVFDNEDTDNQDYATGGGVAPGWSRRDWTGTRLEFCFVPGTGVHLDDPPLPPWFLHLEGTPSGAFALPGKEYYWYKQSTFPFTRYSWCSDSQEALLDGEDDGFAGSIQWEGMPEAYKSRVNAIMDIRYGAPHFFINSCPHGIPVGN